MVYLLPLRASGQFGLIVMLLSFFVFLCGFERIVDLQRRAAAASEARTDRLIVATLRFYVVNQALLLPPLGALLLAWVGLTPAEVALTLVIAVIEHFCNEVYRISIFAPRYGALLWVVFAKNLAVPALAAAAVLAGGLALDLATVLWAWAVASVVAFAILASGFARRLRLVPGEPAGAEMRVARQYRASLTHFIIGLVALFSIQVDRLIVGSLLTLELSGVYFRHLFLAAAVYQVTTVASHNRIVLRVFQALHASDAAAARRLIRRELRRVLAAAALIIAAILLVDPRHLPHAAAATFLPVILAGLVLAFVLRLAAEYHSVFLNGAHREADVLRSQVLAVTLSAGVNVLLTSVYGLHGTVTAMAIGAAAYLLIIGAYARRVR